jgi:hypothetical protein
MSRSKNNKQQRNQPQRAKKVRGGSNSNRRIGTRFSGVDFVNQISIRGITNLENDISPVDDVYITPLTFKGTRLELLANTYQYYKFDTLTISYKPTIPTSVNALFMVYFDTDPNDENNPTSSDELLRIAQSHKLSKQVPANKAWSVSMPIRNDDTYYFCNDDGDNKRLSVQGRLHIIQMGAATNFSGEKIKNDISAGALTIRWSVQFREPQMNVMDRVFNGVTQASILRSFSKLISYRRFDYTHSANTCHVPGTRYRACMIPIDPQFLGNKKGSYLVQKIPIQMSIANTVKTITTVAHSGRNKHRPSRQLVLDEDVNANQGWPTGVAIGQWIDKITKTVEGGISAAVKVFDVISLIAPLFALGQATGSQVLVTYDDNNLNDHQYLPIGSTVIHYDGIKTPTIEEFVEFIDESHATDSTVAVTYSSVYLFFELDTSKDKGIVESNLPTRIPE